MDQTLARRARNAAEMFGLGGKMFVPAEIEASLRSYRPRPTDVVITPFGKCGTTWLQQIFHTLRTRGDFDFDDISRVVPWLETAAALGLDLEAPQRAEPRGFKSHLGYAAVPKGARYIVALRDPRDALVSWFRFMEGWFLEPGAVALNDFAQGWVARDSPGGDYWSHLLSWWAVRDQPNVYLLSYEGMIAAPEATIRGVAAFIGVDLDDELLALTLERSSFAFMLAHKDRFDDAMMRAASEARCNLPPGSDSAKVRAGGVGGHRGELSDDLAAALDARWAETVAPVTGFAEYATLEAEVRRRNAS